MSLSGCESLRLCAVSRYVCGCVYLCLCVGMVGDGRRVWLVSMSLSCSVGRWKSSSALVIVLNLACIVSRIPRGGASECRV